ncbi:MAG: DNA mismatch repair endonuclease MutL [Candidatus Omnitrophica bacterium]|nr:DNA mismatch repair endonuclease MutL [Candidatus Omnitrophota bacterium]
MPVLVLAPDVIAKIAAGEVVERPASVIKELVENSLDAGSTNIEVHIKDAGKELIHIKDDGCGIAKDDLEQIFQRHATSKISNMEDLEKLASMGFRGEALYSVAAVSDIILRSKTPVIPAKAGIQKSGSPIKTFGNDNSAWEIHLQGGKRLDLKPTALSAQGTEIKITQLFYNTPARRKFLKSTTAEMQQIVNVFLPYALLYPQKRFVLTHGERSLIDLKPAFSAIDRIADALNLESKDFIETTQEFVELNSRVRMVLSNINVQRPRRDLQFIFVNNRPVESKNLSFNLNDIYRLILPPGVYPAFLLDIQIDPSEVDVNIHPTKREVRIRQEARLVSFVRHLTEYTLMQQGQAKTLSADEDKAAPMHQRSAPGAWPTNSITSPEQIVFNPMSSPNSESSIESHFLPTEKLGGHTIGDNFDTRPALGRSSHWQTSETSLFKNADNMQDKFARARYIGSFIHKYLIFETDQSMFLVDQHAAQERIMFEKFENQINAGTIEIQHLLTPILLKLTPAEHIAWEESAQQLKTVGIETTAFDDDTIAIQTQPILLKNIENALRVLLSGDDIARCDRTTIARRACKASIVSGDRLDVSQAAYQRNQLLACKDPFTCPHGRPTVVELKESFLDKQFLRI